VFHLFVYRLLVNKRYQFETRECAEVERKVATVVGNNANGNAI